MDQCSLSPADNGSKEPAIAPFGELARRMHMSRGSKVFRPTDLPESNSSGYPASFRDAQRKRWNRRLGDHGGLKNYGVNFVRVEPGGQSSARHSHTKQDEFVYIIEGEFVLVTDAGRETVGPGTCIAFPAGTGDGHHFLNSTTRMQPFWSWETARQATKSLIRASTWS